MKDTTHSDNPLKNILRGFQTGIEYDPESEEVALLKEIDDYLLHPDKRQDDSKKQAVEQLFDDIAQEYERTINNTLKIRNRPSSENILKGYAEGYFNEIIQNANDALLNNDFACNNQPHSITVLASRPNEENQNYRVFVVYPDRGFTLADIFGFCTKENSNKSKEKGQVGKFGVGIKSLFAFVDRLAVYSNVQIEATIQDVGNKGKAVDSIKIQAAEQIETDNGTPSTVLYFEFSAERPEQELFHVSKLKTFIDALYQTNNETLFHALGYGNSSNSILFDANSLLFTDLNQQGIGIKKVEFQNENGTIASISCTDSISEDTTTTKNQPTVSLSTIQVKVGNETREKNYLVLKNSSLKDAHKANLSFAFEYDHPWENTAVKVYSTYLIDIFPSYQSHSPFGYLVNTTSVDVSRSKIDFDFLETLSNSWNQLLLELISLPEKKESSEADQQTYRSYCSDVLCQLLSFCSYQCSDELFKELENLLLFDKLYIAPNKGGIYFPSHEDQIDFKNETIEKNMPSYVQDAKDMYTVFNNFFLENLVVCKDNCTPTTVSCGIRTLAEKYKNSRIDHTISSGLSPRLCDLPFPFFCSGKEVITFMLEPHRNKYNFNNLTVDELKNLQKLLGRFEADPRFDFSGNATGYALSDFLFDRTRKDGLDRNLSGDLEGMLSNYSELKKFITSQKLQASYTFNALRSSYIIVGFPKSRSVSCQKADSKVVKQLLSLLECNSILNLAFFFQENDWIIHSLTETNRKIYPCKSDFHRINSYTKDYREAYIIDYLHLNFLRDFEAESFYDFVSFRSIVDQIQQKAAQMLEAPCSNTASNWEAVNTSFKKNPFHQYLTMCHIHKANLELLQDIFQWLSSYQNREILKFQIDQIDLKIPDNSDDIFIQFLNAFWKKDLKIALIPLTTNRKSFIGFLTNCVTGDYQIYLNGEKDSFKPLTMDTFSKGSGKDDPRLLVFYSEKTDKQTAMCKVINYFQQHSVLASANISDTAKLIENFIGTDNLKQIDHNTFDSYLERPQLAYRYPFEEVENDDLLFIYGGNEFDASISYDDLFTVLTSRNNYNHHCPICNHVPTFNINKNITLKQAEESNTLVAVIPARYQERTVYVKIICCKSCFEEYKVSLTDAVLSDDLSTLTLSRRISDSFRCTDLTRKIPLSPAMKAILKNQIYPPSPADQ